MGPFPYLVGTSYQYWPPRSMGQPLNFNLKHIIQVVHLGGKSGLTLGGPLHGGPLSVMLWNTKHHLVSPPPFMAPKLPPPPS